MMTHARKLVGAEKARDLLCWLLGWAILVISVYGLSFFFPCLPLVFFFFIYLWLPESRYNNTIRKCQVRPCFKRGIFFPRTYVFHMKLNCWFL